MAAQEATSAFFPVDERTLEYLRFTGRGELIDRVERYTKAQGLFRTDADPAPTFTEILELDSRWDRTFDGGSPATAGPGRAPQGLGVVRRRLRAARRTRPQADGGGSVPERGGNPDSSADEKEWAEEVTPNGRDVGHGSVVIAAITSCTNTSNPSVMVAAGLLAKRAVDAGMESQPWVKTSLAPGSRVVTDYLDRAGLTPYLEKLGFNLVGYGCTTCIGNSGPLPDDVAKLIDDEKLNVVAVLSGNRNFEGRIHPQVRASYLASPPLVVAYALAGRINFDPTTEPLGDGADGPVFLRDLWPSPQDVAEVIATAVTEDRFIEQYSRTGKATIAGERCRRRPGRRTSGIPTRPMSANRPSSRIRPPARSGTPRWRERVSTAPGSWSRWATPSPRITSRPRARSVPIPPQVGTSSNTGSSRANSTPTERDEGTTK